MTKRVLWPARVRVVQRPFPSRRVRRWRRWAARGCLALGLMATAVLLSILGPRWLHKTLSHPFFSVARFVVEGNVRLSDAEVLAWLGAQDGMNIWRVDPRAWRSRLLSHSWIQAAEVRRELPRRVHIRIRERWPVAVVRWQGTFQYVDRGGRLLGVVNPVHAAEFPVLTLSESVQAQPRWALKMGLRFLRLCARLGYSSQLSEVVVDTNGITVYPVGSRTAVVLGFGQWRDRLTRSARVFAAWEGQQERLQRVDVSFRNVVVVRLREVEQERSKTPRPRLHSRPRQSV